MTDTNVSFVAVEILQSNEAAERVGFVAVEIFRSVAEGVAAQQVSFVAVEILRSVEGTSTTRRRPLYIVA